ncbi:MAG: hypothetical protein ABIP85_04120 [Chthoniobacteraceae bacterium]
MKTKVVPLTWNLPGQTWNSALKWNGTTTTQTMTTKATIDFTSYTAPELIPVAQTIHDQMAVNAASFPSPSPTVAALLTDLTTYQQKLAARASNATADVLAFQAARAVLEGALHDLGIYVNFIAKGDAATVQKSGYPSYSTGTGTGTGTVPGPSTIPAAPADLKLRLGALSGSIIARFKPDRPSSFNVAWTTTGNPTEEAGWHAASQGTGGKITISGLTPATILWVRVATVGAGGQLGAWSDPAKIVVA